MLGLIALSFTARGVNTVIKVLQMALRSPQGIEYPGRLPEGVRVWEPEQVTVPWKT